MPGRDGTASLGGRLMMGRGFRLFGGINAGRCAAGIGFGLGPGFVCRCDFGTKELLEEKKRFLQNRIDILNKQLENLEQEK